MKKLLTAAVVSIAMLAGNAAWATTDITVLYPYPFLFRDLLADLASKFEEDHPDVNVEFWAGVKGYEQAAETVVRGATTGLMPDVALQGLNRTRIFADRNLAVDLGKMIAQEKGWEKMGYVMLAPGQVRGKQYSMPFAVSTPIMMVNATLVRQAGGDPNNLPKTWPAVIELAAKIDQLGEKIHGMYYDWLITGNWMWQALVFSHGGSLLTPDETRVAFDDEVGLKSLELLRDFVTKTDMPNYNRDEAKQAWVAGTIGMYFTSTASVARYEKQIGDRFEFKTAGFPLSHPDGTLPTGGSGAMIFSTDPAKQEAAWEFVKFITGPVGSTAVAKGTGYMPPNALPLEDPDLLGRFYEKHPNHLASVKQQPIMVSWYAFPGENALKITEVIQNHLETVVLKKEDDLSTVLHAMAGETQELLPKRQ